MKDAKDPGTMDLLEEEPYLVISTTKKGYREYKARWDSNYMGHMNWKWQKDFRCAAKYELTDLPRLLGAVSERRAVTVGIVIKGVLHTLGVTRYLVQQNK